MSAMMSPLETLQNTLKRRKLENLLPFISSWTHQQLIKAEQQLDAVNLDLLAKQQRLLKETASHFYNIEPIQDVQHADQFQLTGTALRALSQGKVGCILVAGGQGTRLGYSGPKGCFPITPVKQKTLFQYFSEKVQAASQLVNYPLPLAIMTSPLNNQAIFKHFEEHHFFGLAKEQLHFFKQKELPFLDNQGQMFFESPGEIALGPNGNGSSIQAFFHSGIGPAWEAQGIEYVTFIMIDNPLADPFDLKLIEAHLKSSAEMTLKCIERKSSDEKVGVLAHVNQKLRVIEYSEAPVKTWSERNERGELCFPLANISLFCFSLPFLKKISTQPMPLHKAYKDVFHLKKDQTIEKTQGWKFEYFIFDLLEFTDKADLLLFTREDTFAPLKNAEGANSPKTVREALSKYDRKVLAKITHQPIPLEILEIEPAFHYPSESLLRKWSAKKPANTHFIAS